VQHAGATQAEAEVKRTRVDRSFPEAVRAEVHWRSGGFCERCGRALIVEYHHKLRRAQGGMGTLDNCAGLCGPCHVHVHANPAESYEAGWLLHPSFVRCQGCKQPLAPIEFGSSGYCDQCSRDALDDLYGQTDALRGEQ
jgi:hypothetical protein